MSTSTGYRYWGYEVYKSHKIYTLLFLSFNFCEILLYHEGRIVENVQWGGVY